MYYKRIVIIGLGSLGGFLAKSCSYLDGLEELLLIDYDKVTERNMNNSIYTYEDIDCLKTYALIKKLIPENPKTPYVSMNIYFREEKDSIVLENSDLVFDCRNCICNRYDLIHVRLSFSLDSLIIDCTNKVKYAITHDVRYRRILSRSELLSASMIVKNLIITNAIYSLINKQEIQQFYLNKISSQAIVKLNENIKNRHDIIIDKENDHFINLDCVFMPIISMNKISDLKILLNSKSNPSIIKNIPINTLSNLSDIMTQLLDAISHVEPKKYLISYEYFEKEIVLHPYNGLYDK